MADFNGEQIREYKGGNTAATGTLAKGEYFQAEYGRLYSNDNHLKATKVDRAGDTIDGDLTIKGKLSVIGEIASIQSTDLEIKDRIITLNKGETGAGVTAGSAGIEVDRGSDSKFFFGFSESLDRFVAGIAGALKKLINEDDVGNESGKISINNGTVNTDLNADKVDGADLSTDVTLATNTNAAFPSILALRTFLTSYFAKAANYTSVTTYSGGVTNTAPSDGWLLMQAGNTYGRDCGYSFYVNGTLLTCGSCSTYGDHNAVFIYLKEGDTFIVNGGGNLNVIRFYPCRLVES